LSKEVKVKRVE